VARPQARQLIQPCRKRRHGKPAALPLNYPDIGLTGTLYRDYGTGLGRRMTPDPVGGDITSPQSLNRYAYALNNPETLTDPSGLWPRDQCPGPAAWGCDAIRHGVGGSLFQDPFSLIGIPVVVWGYGWIAVQGSGFPGPSFSGSVGGGDFSATSYLNVTAYWGPTTLGYAGDAFGLWGGALTPPVPLGSSPTRSNFSWWGTFARSFVQNFSLKSARQPGESFSACVDRTQTALLGDAGKSVLGGVTGTSLGIGAATTRFGSGLVPTVFSTDQTVVQTRIGRSLLDLMAEGGYQAGTISAGTAEALTAGGAALSKIVVPVFGAAVGLELGFLAGCR
jgi:RHS repeat-associated protein